MTKQHVNSNKQEALARRMEKLEIKESDLEEQFIKGSGSGGQKINKTNSCVQLTHKPTGIVIKCQKSRSQNLNRYYARLELVERIAEKINGEKSKRKRAAAKIRKQKQKRSKRAKEKMLTDKRLNKSKKDLRKPPKRED